MSDTLDWLPAGRRFSFDQLVSWRGKGMEPFASVAARCDTVLSVPHAGAAFPAELRPFIAPALTRRLQHDFADPMAGPLALAWAGADPHVIAVLGPMSRLVQDANRPQPVDPLSDLRECFARVAATPPGAMPRLAGIDGIRPITFGGVPLLRRPADDDEWQALGGALADATVRGPLAYAAALRQVVDAVLRARPGRPLRLISLHDRMNTRATADGALVAELPPAEQLPRWANMGNRGSHLGEPADEPVTLAPTTIRAWRDAWSRELGASLSDFTLNQPARGGHEATHWGRVLIPRGVDSGAMQVDFRREALLGPVAAEALRRPGDDWPEPDRGHLEWIAQALSRAGAALR